MFFQMYCLHDATNLTQVSLETNSCAIQETCSFLKLVDKDGRCKSLFACDWNRIEGFAHLARPAHFVRYEVASGSRWRSTNKIGSWITIRSHASLGQTARLYIIKSELLFAQDV